MDDSYIVAAFGIGRLGAPWGEGWDITWADTSPATDLPKFCQLLQNECWWTATWTSTHSNMNMNEYTQQHEHKWVHTAIWKWTSTQSNINKNEYAQRHEQEQVRTATWTRTSTHSNMKKFISSCLSLSAQNPAFYWTNASVYFKATLASPGHWLYIVSVWVQILRYSAGHD